MHPHCRHLRLSYHVTGVWCSSIGPTGLELATRQFEIWHVPSTVSDMIWKTFLFSIFCGFHDYTLYWFASNIDTGGLYTMSQKTRHQTLGCNFANYNPIFKIFSVADSVVNLQQIHVSIFHRALNMSLHYLVKYECRKMASFWNTYCNQWWITR